MRWWPGGGNACAHICLPPIPNPPTHPPTHGTCPTSCSADVLYQLKATCYKKGALLANIVGYLPVTIQVCGWVGGWLDHLGGWGQ